MPFSKGRFLLPFFLFFFSSHSFAQLEKLANDQQWLNLIRYQDGKSLVVNKDWFLAKDGRTNPLAELKATLELYKNAKKSDCRFPARALYLQKHGLLKKQNYNHCEKFQYFQKKIKLDKVHVVFASFYINNPSSAFGHTLFKIEGKDQKNDLLQYGVNFAANLTTANPVLYAIMGLSGGFEGAFSLLPYYIKIREYNNSESRDLWEYEVNLNAFQKELFLNHLWEMDHARFDYYYLTENCSYHILAFLDAINPEWNLVERLHYFVMPVETLKVLTQTPGLLKNTVERPGQFKLLKARQADLPKELQNQAENFLELDLDQRKAYLSRLSELHQKKFLDYLIDYFDFKNQNDLIFEKNPKLAMQKLKLLGLRAKVKGNSSLPKMPKGESPHLVHPEQKITLHYEDNNIDQKALVLEYRRSFHNLLDPQIYAPRWGVLEMGTIAIGVQEEKKKKKVYLKDTKVFQVAAHPTSLLSPIGLAWSASLGMGDRKETTAREVSPYFTFSAGPAFQNKWFLSKLIIESSASYDNKSYNNHALLEASPLFQINLNLFEKFLFQGQVGRRYYLDKKVNDIEYFSFESSLILGKNTALPVSWEGWGRKKNLTIGFRYYF